MATLYRCGIELIWSQILYPDVPSFPHVLAVIVANIVHFRADGLLVQVAPLAYNHPP
jgi:hypothetical protein